VFRRVASRTFEEPIANCRQGVKLSLVIWRGHNTNHICVIISMKWRYWRVVRQDPDDGRRKCIFQTFSCVNLHSSLILLLIYYRFRVVYSRILSYPSNFEFLGEKFAI
jgi:hypothetical protein